jgi:hypothetical protein
MANEVDTKDIISVMNRLNYLSEKSRVGTSGIGDDLGKEFKGGLTPEENAELDKLSEIAEPLLKSTGTRPVYGIKNPNGTTTLSYTNPTAKEEEAYRQKYGANTSLAQAGVSPYGGGKVLNWEQKQQAMKRVEELRPNYATLPYAQQQEFDAIQRNLYASISVNADNPNPPEANAKNIYDNTPQLMKQSGQWGPSKGVQVGAEPGSMPNAQAPKTVTSQTKDANGTTVVTYEDGTKTTTTANGSTTTTDANGNPVEPNGSGTMPQTGSSDYELARQDAFAALQDLFTSYGLGSLSNEISDYMISGYTASEALIKLKTNPNGAYAERFAGNFARAKKGLNVMKESAYIELEDSYANTLKAYGLGNMLSTDSKQNWKQFSEYIANDINAPEFKDRIATVEDRVVNADPTIKETFKKWYPNLTDKDLVAYFLNPTETIGKLKEKVTSAEIGAAFIGQGLATDATSATDYAKYGLDRGAALQGAADIKSVLPTSEKLSDIYGEAKIDYTQKTAEEEVFKGNADAALKRKRLASLERAKFGGDSGIITQGATTLSKNLQGTF